MKATLFFAITFISFSVFSGCKTTEIRYIPLETIRTEVRNNYLRDSIYLHDSVYVHNTGDTVFVHNNRYLYVDKVKHDSIHIHDSIKVPFPVEVVKEKITNKLNWWQQTSMYAGWLLMVVGGGYLLLKNRSKILTFIVSFIKKLF